MRNASPAELGVLGTQDQRGFKPHTKRTLRLAVPVSNIGAARTESGETLAALGINEGALRSELFRFKPEAARKGIFTGRSVRPMLVSDRPGGNQGDYKGGHDRGIEKISPSMLPLVVMVVAFVVAIAVGAGIVWAITALSVL